MKTFLTLLGIVFALLVCVGGWLVYTSFYGSPFDAWRARQVMERYLTETYPGKVFTIGEVKYMMKFGNYEARVMEGAGLDFNLAATAERVEYDEYRWTWNMDKAMTERFEAQLSGALDDLLAADFPGYHSTHTGAYAAAGEYAADARYYQGLERDWDFEIAVVGQDEPPDTFARRSAAMRDAILAAGYQPRSMRFVLTTPETAASKGSMLLYTLKVPAEDYSTPAEELLKQVEAYNLKHR